MKQLFIILTLVLFGYSQMQAQQDAFELELDDAHMVRVDDFQNLYVVSGNNSLYKYDSRLNLQFQFSFNKLGKLTDLDVSNPQKLLLFFLDYQVILYLDNTLSEIDRLNLDEMGYWSISCVGLAPDNLIWMYDTQNNTLVKIDDKGNQLYSSNEFFQEQFAKETEIKILSDQRHTLLYSPEQCLVFDAFGYYLKSLLLLNDKLVLNKDFIFILKDQKISIEALRPRIEEFPPLDLQEESIVKDFDLFKNEYLYYLTDSKLKRIKIN